MYGSILGIHGVYITHRRDNNTIDLTTIPLHKHIADAEQEGNIASSAPRCLCMQLVQCLPCKGFKRLLELLRVCGQRLLVML